MQGICFIQRFLFYINTDWDCACSYGLYEERVLDQCKKIDLNPLSENRENQIQGSFFSNG